MPSTLRPGTRFGPYEIAGPIGAGGMGEVFRATDTNLKRPVAIKVLPAALAGDSDRLARFSREAEVLAALNHPNIAAIYGLERHDGTTGLVMELVDGPTLADRLARGALPLDEALSIARQIAEAFEAAHAQGIVHRDLKPANVKVTPNGTVKVLDFGLAKPLDDEAGAGGPAARLADSPTITTPAMTRAGMILGTAAYIAPEQARGRPVDRRADVWAFGAVLFEMLAGRRAFEGDDLSITMANVLKDDVDWEALPADLPPPLQRLLHRCLEKNPAKRLDSMRAAVLDIDDAAEPKPVTPRRAVAARSTRRARILALAALLTAAVGFGVAAGLRAADTWRPTAARVTEVDYQRLSFDAGFVFAARFAADGRTVVYSADWDGRERDLFMTSVDSRHSRSLGISGADLLALGASGEMAMLLGSTIPAGNPYKRLGSLARGSLTGGLQRAELADVAFADLAADGTLAVVRLTESEALLEFPLGHVLARMPRIGGNYGDRFFVTPRVSPDGRLVAMMVPEGTTRYRTQVFERGGRMVAEDPTGLSDWWGLAWRTATEVWIAGTEVAGRKTVVYGLGLGGSRRLVFRAPAAMTLHDISPAGDVLASFDQFGGRSEIVTPDGEIRDLTWQDGGVSAGLADDGLVLVNQEGDGGGPNATALVFARGRSEPVRIAEGAAQSVSPDGTRALVLLGQRVQLVPVGAGQPQSFDVGSMELGWTGWHPDGRVILSVMRQDRSRASLTLDPATGALTPFLPAGVWPSGGRLISPDGRHLIANGADGQLVRCAWPTTTCEPLAGRRPGDEVAGWLADNRTVIVFNDRTLPGTVEALHVDTGRREAWRTLKPTRQALGGIRRLLVAPDGTMLLGYEVAQTDLYVIRGLR